MNMRTETKIEEALKTMPQNETHPFKMRGEKVSVFYGEKQALYDVDLDIRANQVTALIGPSGCGKSTFLRCLNRMNDTIDICRVTGKITLDGKDIYDKSIDVVELRARVGMVFQKPTPFPMSIYENIAFPLRMYTRLSRAEMDDAVESALRDAALWTEVKDKLHASGLSLSGGQQQRLCIARAIAIRPDVLLLDEPASALDPISTALIDELLWDLRKRYCVVIVTHNMQQAARVSDKVGFMYLGELVEFGDTETVFSTPRERRTQDYITGRFG